MSFRRGQDAGGTESAIGYLTRCLSRQPRNEALRALVQLWTEELEGLTQAATSDTDRKLRLLRKEFDSAKVGVGWDSDEDFLASLQRALPERHQAVRRLIAHRAPKGEEVIARVSRAIDALPLISKRKAEAQEVASLQRRLENAKHLFGRGEFSFHDVAEALREAAEATPRLQRIAQGLPASTEPPSAAFAFGRASPTLPAEPRPSQTGRADGRAPAEAMGRVERAFGEGVRVPPNRPDRSSNRYYGTLVEQESQVVVGLEAVVVAPAQPVDARLKATMDRERMAEIKARAQRDLEEEQRRSGLSKIPRTTAPNQPYPRKKPRWNELKKKMCVDCGGGDHSVPSFSCWLCLQAGSVPQSRPVSRASSVRSQADDAAAAPSGVSAPATPAPPADAAEAEEALLPNLPPPPPFAQPSAAGRQDTCLLMDEPTTDSLAELQTTVEKPRPQTAETRTRTAVGMSSRSSWADLLPALMPVGSGSPVEWAAESGEEAGAREAREAGASLREWLRGALERAGEAGLAFRDLGPAFEAEGPAVGWEETLRRAGLANPFPLLNWPEVKAFARFHVPTRTVFLATPSAKP